MHATYLLRFMVWSFCLLFIAPKVRAWFPGTTQPTAVRGFEVDAGNRTDVLAFHNTVYEASSGYASRIEWTGNVLTGVAGTTSEVFKTDVQRRINYFRALVGLPADITLNPLWSAKCQQAALMFASNNQISHSPPSSWTFFSQAGAEAAANSNISLGGYGADAVDGYIRDDGASNYPVGHRRWLLFSQASVMGTGDVPPSNGKNSGNAIWVISNSGLQSSRAPQFIAWPNAGYSPKKLRPERWSLSYPGADFSAASVSVARAGQEVPLTIVSRTNNGMGDNTIVWEPEIDALPGVEDVRFDVLVSGIRGKSIPTSAYYSVNFFDPGELGETVQINVGTQASWGENISFTQIAQADRYQLTVSTASNATITEGAEDSSAMLVRDLTAGSYALRQSAVKAVGQKAFHLTIPSFKDGDQCFELNREIVPSPTGSIRFKDLFRFVTTTSSLSLEITENNGGTWHPIWSRNGNGGNTSQSWDTSFTQRAVSLSDYVGKVIRARFIFRSNGGQTFLGTSDSVGVFVDDILISDVLELINSKSSLLAGDASSFTLSPSLISGTPSTQVAYFLRIRPQVGTRWFGDGPLNAIAITPSSVSTLSRLEIGSGELTPFFSPSLTSYTAQVANSVSSILLKLTPTDSAAILRINGVVTTGGASGISLPLAVGENQVSIQVTAADGISSKTYTLSIIRKSNVSTLDALSLSSGPLLNPFSKNTFSYSANVANRVSALTVTLSPTDSFSTLKVNGTVVTAGIPSPGVPLTVGNNTITAEVISQDGTSSRTYSVTVTRAPSAVSTLRNLVPGVGTFDLPFTPMNVTPKLRVAHGTQAIAITPTATEETASITVDGKPVASGQASAEVPLRVGENVIRVVVTAPDQVNRSIYSLTITRALSNESRLNELTLASGSFLARAVDIPGSYATQVPFGVSKVQLTLSARDQEAVIHLEGNSAKQGTATAEFPLSAGANTLAVTVTAPDGTTVSSYVISILRQSNIATLQNLLLRSGTLNPAFSPETTDYRVRLAKDQNLLEVAPVPTDSGASVSVNGIPWRSDELFRQIALSGSSTTVGIQVVSPDGSSTQKYSLVTARNFTLSLSPEKGGSVSSGGIYEYGTPLSIAATAEPGFLFSGWAGSLSGSENPMHLVLGGDVFATARFAPDLRDSDGDGLSNYAEVTQTKTNPNLSDSDGNGFSDTWSLLNADENAQFHPSSGHPMTLDVRRLGWNPPFALTDGILPAGLRWNPSTGVIQGTLTCRPGTYRWSIASKETSQKVNVQLEVSPFPKLIAGSYGALVESAEGQPQAFLTFSVTEWGRWTATLERIKNRVKSTARGKYCLVPGTSGARIQMHFERGPGGPPETLEVEFGTGSHVVSGQHANGRIRGLRFVKPGIHRVEPGRYTMLLHAERTPETPGGIGWATGKLNTAGQIALTGELGDGQPFHSETYLCPNGQAVLWTRPYRDLRSVVAGIVSFPGTAFEGDGPSEKLAEGLWWSKARDASAKSYPNGFACAVTAESSLFIASESSAAFPQSLGIPQNAVALSLPSDAGPNAPWATLLPRAVFLTRTGQLALSKQDASVWTGWFGTFNHSTGLFQARASQAGSDLPWVQMSGLFLQAGQTPNTAAAAGLIKIPTGDTRGTYRTESLFFQ